MSTIEESINSDATTVGERMHELLSAFFNGDARWTNIEVELRTLAQASFDDDGRGQGRGPNVRGWTWAPSCTPTTGRT